MKTSLRNVDDHGIKYQALMFCCPGCAVEGSTGLHMLPVNSMEKSPSWNWDGNREAPTLSPSILTKSGPEGVRICHSFLRAGVFEFLSDCTHHLAGQNVAMPDLPTWEMFES
jgi:hypothetical protein